MKNLLLRTVFLFCLSVNACFAQDTDFKKALVHAGKQSYNVSELVAHHKYVQNTNRHVYKANGAARPKVEIIPRPKDIQYNKASVTQIVLELFSDTRLKRLADEGLDLQINYNVDIQGNILDVSFLFADNSSLTPIEIEQLEGRLKSNLKFTLSAKVFEGNTYIPLHNFVNFKRLINHLPDAVYP